MKTAHFFQSPPTLTNQFEGDVVLRSHLRRVLPKEIWQEIAPDLRNFGQRVITDVLKLAIAAESQVPTLRHFDAWGRRIDHLEVSQAWNELGRVAASEGLIAIGYERRFGPWSRVYQLAKQYLFGPSSAIYNCPLAMTDGAARLIELHGDAELHNNAFMHLTSRHEDFFWTSGQWMTERRGGSDIAHTQTTARLTDAGYCLFGDKWFTSATTAPMAMTLARIEDEQGTTVAGSRGLSLFYLETRLPSGHPNGIQLHRLKDKLGTRALPTAELTLDGTQAKLIGKAGNGVKLMATLFNITRVYNAVAAVGMMRRTVALAQDYARRRSAFERQLSDQPLHGETLADLVVEIRAGFHLVFTLIAELGAVEYNKSDQGDSAALVRILTPIAKLYTAKQAVAVISEALECFGGAGYVEDTGIPKWLRDAQVLPIWEGTTNVLSLDVLRAIGKEQAFTPLEDRMQRILRDTNILVFGGSVAAIQHALGELKKFVARLEDPQAPWAQAKARRFAMGLARTFAATCMLEHAQWATRHDEDPAAVYAALRYCQQPLVTDLSSATPQDTLATQRLALS